MPGGGSRQRAARNGGRLGSTSTQVPQQQTVLCAHCKNKILDDSQDSIECERCVEWFHGACVSVPDSLIGLLSVPGVHWFCSKCDQNSCKFVTLEKKVDEIKDLVSKNIDLKVAQLEKTYAEAVKKIETNSEVIVNAAQKTIQKDERESKENRERNLIIFGLPESSKEETLADAQSLLEQCSVGKKVDADNLFRLGSLDKVKEGRSRPLKLCTSSRVEKWDILKRINSLRKSGVFARPDLSLTEREEDFRLRQELKKSRENSPHKKFKIHRKKVIEITT